MLFRCCSFAAAAAVISLSSTADADAADRSTTTTVVVAAIVPAEHENYDESSIANRSMLLISSLLSVSRAKKNRSSAPLKDQVVENTQP